MVAGPEQAATLSTFNLDDDLSDSKTYSNAPTVDVLT